MSILYALIAKNFDIVLCEYSEYNGNYQQITRILLRKVQPNRKFTIEYDNYKYHYINQDNLTYLCMTSNFPEDIAFGFLIDVQKQFLETYDYDKILSATSYLLDNFQEKLKKLMAYYNTCPQKTQTGQIIKDLIDAKSTAVENIEKLISRDQKLNIIVAKSDSLNTQSRNINNIAQKIKTQQKLKKMRNMRLIIGAVIIFVILLFIVLF